MHFHFHFLSYICNNDDDDTSSIYNLWHAISRRSVIKKHEMGVIGLLFYEFRIGFEFSDLKLIEDFSQLILNLGGEGGGRIIK